MNLLSLETTSKRLSLAVFRTGRPVVEQAWESSDAAREIVPVLQGMLKETSMAMDAFDYVVISTGPGSWTGTRMGIALAKGLVLGERKRLYAISTFEGLRHGMPVEETAVCCIVDAARGKFYCSFFSGSAPADDTATETRILTLEELGASSTGRTLLAGPAVADIAERMKDHGSLVCAEQRFWYPSATRNGYVALRKLARGVPSLPPEPFYGR